MKIWLKGLITTVILVVICTTVTAQVVRVKIAEVEKIIDSSSDKIVILNLWATFCKPCVEEIPSFVNFSKTHVDVELYFLSLDLKEAFPKQINKMIKQLGMRGKNLWLDETDADYFAPKISEEWSGAIPATLIMNARTGKKKFIDAEMTEKELSEVYISLKSASE